MRRRDDYDEAFARADAREKELQRQLGMSDGVKTTPPRSFNNNFNRFNTYSVRPPMGNAPYQGTNMQQAPMGFQRNNVYMRSDPRSVSRALSLLAAFFYILTVILATVGVVAVVSIRNTYSSCTETVEGTVIENEYNRSKDVYYPVFQYKYGDSVYNETSNHGSKPAKYTVGEKVTVHVNPDNPSVYYVDKTDYIVIIVMSILTGAFLALAIALTFARARVRKDAHGALQ